MIRLLPLTNRALALGVFCFFTLQGCVRGEVSDGPGALGGASAQGGSGNAQGGASNGGSVAAGGNRAGGAGGVGGVATNGGSAGTASGGTSASLGGNGGSGGVVPEDSQPPPKLCQITLQCDAEIEDDPKVACALTIVDGAGVNAYADHAGVELRGRSSIKYPKPNYSIELRTAAAVENPTNLLGMGKESDWVLDGSWVDRSFMRNALTYSLFRDMGSYAPRGRFCNLSLNGEARGIYELREKIKRDDDRVALSDDDGSGQSFLLKQDDDGSLRLSIGAGRSWMFVYPNQEVATPTQVMAAQSFLDRLDMALNSTNPGDATNGLPALLDMAQIVDWVLLEEFTKNIDAYNLSLFIARDAGKPARFVPWDFDLAYGQPTLRNAMNEAATGWVNTRTRLITALSKIDSFKSALGPRWRALRAGPLSNAAISRKIDRYQTTLEPNAVAANFTRWPLADVDFSQIYAPYTLYPVSSYTDEVAHLRAYIEARLTFIDSRIDGYPN